MKKPVKKPVPKQPPKPKPVDPTGRGSALWFVRELLSDGRPNADIQDLLAIGVRMSEADRIKLVQILS